ncbi:MAG: hypothetical protein PF542_03240 [Nanoarchaeota archaeon]|jgi:hypothetical protein|nr:hypothetical protein [Nanoarchaeota archaeon]
MRKSLVTLLFGASVLFSAPSFAQEAKAKYNVSAGWLLGKIGEVEGNKDSFDYDLGGLGQLRFSRRGNTYMEEAFGKKGSVKCLSTVEGDSIRLDSFSSYGAEWGNDAYMLKMKEQEGKKVSLEYNLGIDWFDVFEKEGPMDTLKMMFFSQPHVAYLVSEELKKNGDIEASYRFEGDKLYLPDEKALGGLMKVVMKEKADGTYDVMNLMLEVNSNTILGYVDLEMEKVEEEE